MTLNQYEYDELLSLKSNVPKFSEKIKMLLKNKGEETLLNEVLKADECGGKYNFTINCNTHNGFLDITITNGFWMIGYKGPQ
ncbi:hypothetical protein EIL92_02650 [Campylobacter jejuni]|uniref:hypothetical protein n=1 Tax=Campylobacter sp. BCW_6871 TaxID=1903284 RepID=UPI0008735B38|nr:hypothetical protein [Campylobacter sp. BCW_6871]EAB5248495.1 hypothetical protein [Campylobacter jejuni]EAK7750499.1 hypothetical protein [Campylobacter jejuni]EDP2685609.1 hypothetical protein [Campylobacter jejuni]OEW03886.1 hypothetical protein AJ930_07620 [Campylobacter sp. BCW_6871]HDZ4263995.1 hypothetical protein [Campylobacter jejuni]